MGESCKFSKQDKENLKKEYFIIKAYTKRSRTSKLQLGLTTSLITLQPHLRTQEVKWVASLQVKAHKVTQPFLDAGCTISDNSTLLTSTP
jgi:hypothetical protein